MEFVYVYVFGLFSGIVATIIASRNGASIYSQGITKITEPYIPEPEPEEKEGKKAKDPESWDWDVYDDYINRGIDDEE